MIEAVTLCVLYLFAGMVLIFIIPFLYLQVALVLFITAWAWKKTQEPLREVFPIRWSGAWALIPVCLAIAGADLVILAIQYPSFLRQCLPPRIAYPGAVQPQRESS
jgi:hypothetical protein